MTICGVDPVSPRPRTPASTARSTSSLTLTSSRNTSAEPASARDISKRSPTMRWNRRRSSPNSWRARWARGGRLSRSASRTSSEAESVVRGERSSWLTSELNRASRWIRAWSWSTMVLNELVRPSRSGSAASAPKRVSSRPPAMATAARDTADSGRSDRRLANRPSARPSNVVTTPVPRSVTPSTRKV